MEDKFIVKDEQEFIKLVRAKLEIKIKSLVDRGIRVIRSHGFLVDVVSQTGEKLSNEEKRQALFLAERILELQRREEQLNNNQGRTNG